MTRTTRAFPALFLMAALAPAAPGCGVGSADEKDTVLVKNSMEETALGEVGTLYRDYTAEANKPPQKLDDLSKLAGGTQFANDFLTRGDIVAFYNAKVSDDASGTVLAYEKKVPAGGGFVLMQDGKTVKKMTADEFQAAPKAGEVKAAAKSKK